MINKDRKPVHVAMFSGGAASAYVAYYMVQTYGKENCKLFFTNTLWEDDDNWRFMYDVADYIGLKIDDDFYDGRTPEEVFFHTRFLGNSQIAKCSEELKVRQTILFLEDLRDNYNLEPILYFGIGPHEKHRSDNLTNFYENYEKNLKIAKRPSKSNEYEESMRLKKSLTEHFEHKPLEPVETRFPLIDTIREDIDVKSIIQNEWGIKLPRMYYLAKEKAEKENDATAKMLVDNGIYGFSHANCSGRCVRGGFQHYAILYSLWKDRYMEQEEMEDRFRSHFEKNVSILKKNGKPYTLKRYREDIEKNGVEKYLFTKDEPLPCVCSFS